MVTDTHPTAGYGAYDITGTGVKVSGHINDLREFAENMNNTIKELGGEYENAVSDAFFAICADYQAYHKLDENNWDLIHRND